MGGCRQTLVGSCRTMRQPQGGGTAAFFLPLDFIMHYSPASVYSLWMVFICHFKTQLFTGAVSQSDCAVLQKAALHQSQQVGNAVKKAQ